MNGLRVAAIALAAIASAPAWGQEALTPGTYEEDNPNVVYSGKWIHQTREGPTKKTIRTTIDHAAAIDFRIRGTAFEIGVLTYDDRYQLNLCVDGKCKVHDIFTLDIHWRVPIVVSGLSDGEHSVRMTLNTDKGGKAIDLDWVRVFPSRDPLSIGTHRYDSPSIQYSPNWQNFEDFKRSHREPSVFFFDFVGAKATLRLRTADYYGETFICLDGKCEVHNLYSVSYGWRDIVLTADPGRHHVRVEKGKSRVVGLHSVVVE